MAAYLYEAMVEPDAMPGNTTFVAGFTQCMYLMSQNDLRAEVSIPQPTSETLARTRRHCCVHPCRARC